MTNAELSLIKLLACSLSGQVYENTLTTVTSWAELFEKVEDHNLQACLYPSVKETLTSIKGLEYLSEEWRNDYLLSHMVQSVYEENIHALSDLFLQHDLTFYIFKGAVLRSMYPPNAFRIMSDFDILVSPEDLTSAINVLEKLGYTKEPDKNTHKHLGFAHPKFFNIDLHFNLIDKSVTDKSDSFTDCFCKSAAVTQCCNRPLLVPNPYYHLLYMFLHMGSHLAGTGFGLRQLADVSVLLDQYKDTFDYMLLMELARTYKIEKLCLALLNLCHHYLGTTIADQLIFKDAESLHLNEQFMTQIVQGGVFGNTNDSQLMENSFLFYSNPKANADHPRLSYFLFLFPSYGKISEREDYRYLKKTPFLLPIAWIHRFFLGLISPKRHMSDALSILKQNNIRANQRSHILYWLELDKKK